MYTMRARARCVCVLYAGTSALHLAAYNVRHCACGALTVHRRVTLSLAAPWRAGSLRRRETAADPRRHRGHQGEGRRDPADASGVQRSRRVCGSPFGIRSAHCGAYDVVPTHTVVGVACAWCGGQRDSLYQTHCVRLEYVAGRCVLSGADVDAKSAQHGNTALIVAASRLHRTVVLRLLSSRADVNAATKVWSPSRSHPSSPPATTPLLQCQYICMRGSHCSLTTRR